MTVVIKDKGIAPRLDSVWVVLGVSTDGNEGIAAWRQGDILAPLVAADPARVEFLRQAAEVLAQQTGGPMRLVRFSAREDIDSWPWPGRA